MFQLTFASKLWHFWIKKNGTNIRKLMSINSSESTKSHHESMINVRFTVVLIVHAFRFCNYYFSYMFVHLVRVPNAYHFLHLILISRTYVPVRRQVCRKVILRLHSNTTLVVFFYLSSFETILEFTYVYMCSLIDYLLWVICCQMQTPCLLCG